MEATQEAIFQLMRFQILARARASLKDTPFDSGYIYAWDAGVYPAFNDGADWHKPFPNQFFVSEDEVHELAKFLDEKWLAKEAISFYDIESTYGVHGSVGSDSDWSRVKLLTACRYMALNRMFDEQFWSKVTENGKCPSEALSLATELRESDIYLM